MVSEKEFAEIFIEAGMKVVLADMDETKWV